MPNVTNNHKGTLNVAGVEVRPRATVSVDAKDFDMWKNRHAAKIWLEAGLISTGGKAPAKQTGGANRTDLEAQADGLDVAFTADTTDEELAQAVKEAQDRAKGSEREDLLKEARELGLNPNANTGVEKLRKMIADKKG